MEGQLPSFAGATGWLNSEPLTPEGLRGRVVLVDFWTYTCVNWLRTLPYVRAWDEKYADQGLTTIGVHTPEFAFEHDLDNITTQARALNVPYPIAVDSDYGVWNAFANHYWPAIYLADGQGRIRYHHFGEGEYAMRRWSSSSSWSRLERRTWPWIWSPSTRWGSKWRLITRPCAPRRPTWATARRPGWPRRTASGPMSRTTTPRRRSLRLNEWAPAGAWAISRRAATATAPNARLAYRFQARDVNLVMGPACREPRSPSASTSMASRQPARMEPMSMPTAMARRGAAYLPTHPPTGPDHRARLRDRVPRPGRRALLLHLRLIGGNGLERGSDAQWFMTHLNPMTLLATIDQEITIIMTMTERDSVNDTATSAIRPFHFEVPQQAIDDLRQRIAATQWPEKETVADTSQGVPLATMQELARYWATDYDWRKVEAKLNALPQFITEIDGLDIHFIHVRSKHENALPLIVNHGWPGSIIEQLKIIDPLTNPTAHGGSASDAFHRGDSVDAGLRVLRQADQHRLGPRAHGPSLGRTDEAPRLQPLRRPGRRLGCVCRRPDGLAGTCGIARHPHQHARHRSRRRRQGAPGRRPAAIRSLGRGTTRL